MKKSNFRTACLLAVTIVVAACGETQDSQRERLEKLHDEVLMMPPAQMQERLSQLDADDQKVFAEIAQERFVGAQQSYAEGSSLTQRMMDYAAEDEAKANQLVADCEADLGLSANGPDARLIADCVDRRW